MSFCVPISLTIMFQGYTKECLIHTIVIFLFRSIEELQEQNQRLLAILRDVSEEKEQAEASATQEQYVQPDYGRQ